MEMLAERSVQKETGYKKEKKEDKGRKEGGCVKGWENVLDI